MPPDVCLLLRAHAELHYLKREVIPVLDDLRSYEVGGELAEAASAYLEVAWREAYERARKTDAAYAELIASGGPIAETSIEPSAAAAEPSAAAAEPSAAAAEPSAASPDLRVAAEPSAAAPKPRVAAAELSDARRYHRSVREMRDAVARRVASRDGSEDDGGGSLVVGSGG